LTVSVSVVWALQTDESTRISDIAECVMEATEWRQTSGTMRREGFGTAYLSTDIGFIESIDNRTLLDPHGREPVSCVRLIWF
jgi:hypothetical protein